MQEFDSPTRLMNEIPEYEPTAELTTVIMPAIDKARELMLGTPKNQRGLYYVGPSTAEADAKIVRLRLDWEIADDAMEENGEVDNAVLRLLYGQVAGDLDDLLENGDQDLVGDPLLKTVNGSRKRGKKLTALELVEQNLLVRHSERKEATEYTLYVNIVPEWN